MSDFMAQTMFPVPQDIENNLPSIVDESFVNEWRFDIPNELYHADKSAVSSSNLKKILISPRKFYSSHVLGLRKETDAMRFGTALHMAVLEPELFAKTYIIEPKFTGYTKDGKLTDSGSCTEVKDKKAAWKASQLPNAQTLTLAKYEDILGMVESIKKSSKVLDILSISQREVSGYYRDPGTGILCRIRPDIFVDTGILLDVKTTSDCEHDGYMGFSHQAWTREYAMQIAQYCDAARLITGKEVKLPMFLAIETEPPYDHQLYIANAEFIHAGMIDYRAALDKLHACLISNSWVNPEVQILSPPPWALKTLVGVL